MKEHKNRQYVRSPNAGAIMNVVGRVPVVAPAGLALLLGFGLCGCYGGPPPKVVIAHVGGEVGRLTHSTKPRGPLAGWDNQGRLLIATMGSGSCPNLPTQVSASGAHAVVVKTELWQPPGTNACTGDLSPTTSTIAVPAGVDTSSPLTVTIDGVTVHLQPAG